MNEPTEAQAKEFWGLVGFKRTMGGSWIQPDRQTRGFEPPPIDLNSLFKWAVPKVYDMVIRKLNRFEGEWQTAYSVKVRLAQRHWMLDVRDKELKWAMFWAYYKVLKEDK